MIERRCWFPHETCKFVCVSAAIGLLALGYPVGNAVGLLATPSWLITSYRVRHWGAFWVSVVCGACYAVGLVRWLFL